MSIPERTPKQTIIGRLFLVGWITGLVLHLFATIFGVASGIGILFFAICGASGALAMAFVQRVLTHLFAQAVFRGDPDFDEWERQGGDPFFDFLPEPFNNDTVEQRLLGGTPSFFCPKCGVSSELREGCETCGFNARNVQCPECLNLVFEDHIGDLELGVICPFCSTIIQV